ncbi:MAG: restriction endonuclease subunit S [Bacteroidales bacterium]
MSEWKEYKLGEIVVLNYGKALAENKRISGNVPVYSSAEITGWHNEPLVNSKGLIIGRKGTIGKVYYSNTPFFCIDTAYYILPNEKIYDLKFLFYKLKTVGFEDLNEDSAVPGLNRETAYNQKVLLPPLPEQKAIASILSSLDDKIDLLHRQNATLEKMAETLFRQWFVERRPEPDEGEAKEEWESRPLSSIANFLNGLACQKFPPKNDIEKLPVLKIKELNSGISENSDWATTEVNPEYIVKNGDVIFAWSASLMVKIWDGQDCILNQHLFKVTSEYYPKWFYYLWCKYHLDEFIVKAASHATTMGHIKRSDLDEAMVLIPSDKELEEMTLEVEPLISKIINNNKQIKLLVNLRDILLPKLMSGEIRVESHRDETSVETNNDTATLSPVGAAFKTIKHG